MQVVEHNNKLDNQINILPYGETFIQFIITDKTQELIEVEEQLWFLSDFQFDRLLVMFDMWLHRKKIKEMVVNYARIAYNEDSNDF